MIFSILAMPPKIDYADSLALMEAVSPDLEKQGFFAVVFVNREI